MSGKSVSRPEDSVLRVEAVEEAAGS